MRVFFTTEFSFLPLESDVQQISTSNWPLHGACEKGKNAVTSCVGPALAMEVHTEKEFCFKVLRGRGRSFSCFGEKVFHLYQGRATIRRVAGRQQQGFDYIFFFSPVLSAAGKANPAKHRPRAVRLSCNRRVRHASVACHSQGYFDE